MQVVLNRGCRKCVSDVARVLRRHGVYPCVGSRHSEVVISYDKAGYEEELCIGELFCDIAGKHVSVQSGDLMQKHEWSEWSPPWM